MTFGWGLLGVVLLAVPLAGCSSESSSAEPVPQASPGSEGGGLPRTQSIPTRLDCRGRGVVSTDGGLLAAGATPKGADTPELAVEAFLSAMELARHDHVVDGAEAWVLRSDGTAVARVNFLLGDGWTIHGYSLCG
jgi:hypothetical protein